MWLISRRRHDAELAATRDDTDRLRTQRDKSRENAVAWHAAAVRAAEQLIDTSFVNNCLTLDLTKSRRQRVIARKAAARIAAAYTAEKQRADHLQQRLDNWLGLNTSAVRAGQNWQQTREDKPAAKEPS